MTQPEIEPWSPGPLANILSTTVPLANTLTTLFIIFRQIYNVQSKCPRFSQFIPPPQMSTPLHIWNLHLSYIGWTTTTPAIQLSKIPLHHHHHNQSVTTAQISYTLSFSLYQPSLMASPLDSNQCLHRAD